MKKIIIVLLFLSCVYVEATLPERGSLRQAALRKAAKAVKPQKKAPTTIKKKEPQATALIVLQQHGPASSYTHIKVLHAHKSFIERIESDQQTSLYEFDETTHTITNPLSDEQQNYFAALKERAINFAKSKGCCTKWVATIRCYEDGTMALSNKAQ